MKKLVRNILLSTIAAVLIFEPSVTALGPGAYSSNDILYYNPSDVACQISTSDQSAIQISSEDNLEIILRFFTNKGFSLAAAAGIAGNIQQESSLNPKIIQGGKIASDNYQMKSGVGFGLVQWTTGDRQQKLANYAQSKGKPITDMETQLEYILVEMSQSYSRTYSRLAAEKTDPVAAAIIAHGPTNKGGLHPKMATVDPPRPGYEASGDTSTAVVEVRGGNAQKFYDRWNGKIQDGSGVSDAKPVDSTAPTASLSTSTCPSLTTSGLTIGEGGFTDNGEVAGYATIKSNAEKVSAKWGNSLVNQGWCASITSRSWKGSNSGYGYPYARNMWENNRKYLHTDNQPKRGAIMFAQGQVAAGHVFIYLENNKILNDGHITDANEVFGTGNGQWGNKYIGWMDPNDVGWTTAAISDATINSFSQYLRHSGAR